MKHIRQSFILAIESFIFNVFLILGSKEIDPTTTSCVISSYFLFIPVLEFILYKNLPKINTIIAIILVLIGIPLIIGLKLENFNNKRIFFLILADLTISLNIITIGKFAKGSNPAILSIGQLFFISLFSFIFWFTEAKINHVSMTLPKEPIFWGSAIYMSFFIRGLYTVVQIYAQRYIGPLNAALIFSSEIIMTLLLSGIVYQFVFNESNNEIITITKLLGSVLMLLGILINEIDFISLLKGKSN